MEVLSLKEKGHGAYSASNGNSSVDQFLSAVADNFDTGINTTKAALDQAMEELRKNPSDPTALAAYQARLGEYMLYRGAQTQTLKAYRESDAMVVRNFS